VGPPLSWADQKEPDLSLRVCPRCDARFRGDIATCPIDGSTLREPADPFIGRTIAGRYLIEELLGSGGMGTVYRARHQIIGRDVALKFLEPSLVTNERQRKRFLGEARAANQINHEHIIDITDFGETEDGLVYLVMEYLEGRTLSDEIELGPFAPHRALRIVTQVALGLARAHELGVVHRDIKPANIYLVRRKADADYVKILDFGVARIEHDMRITGQGSIVGTPEYIAPEQIHCAAAQSSGDLYSLGCVLFEMLTSRLPFEGKTTSLLVKHLNDPPPTPSSLQPAVPKEVDQLVLRLLQKNPADRFRDAYHLVEALQNLLDELPGVARGRRNDASIPKLFGSAKLLPAPSEEESVYRTIELYRSMLGEAHLEGHAAAWLPQAIEYLEQGVSEVRLLRQRLRNAAEKATAQEEDSRGPRSRIGRALDELAQDDSRLGRQIEGLREALTTAETRLDLAMRTIFEGAAHAVPAKAGRALTEKEALSVTKVVEGARKLASERERALALRAEFEARSTEHNDLRFQIAELKEQLQAINEAATLDQQLAHDEVNRVSAQIQAKLEALAPQASRVSQYFNQFLELRERPATQAAAAHTPAAVADPDALDLEVPGPA
jgi:serine/threonine-protein kinase